MPPGQHDGLNLRDLPGIVGCAVVGCVAVIGLIALSSTLAGSSGIITLLVGGAGLFVLGFLAIVVRFRHLVGATTCPDCGGLRPRAGAADRGNDAVSRCRCGGRNGDGGE